MKSKRISKLFHQPSNDPGSLDRRYGCLWFYTSSRLIKAVAARLVSGDGGPPLGITWLREFLNSHPEHSTKFASGLNRQRALSDSLGKSYIVHTHTRETRTGITKKLFFSFYSQAKRIVYTRANIKAACRATGIQPYNPNAVLVTGRGLDPQGLTQRGLAE